MIKKLIIYIINRYFKRQYCFYINGPDTLPPPLTKEEEETIMSQIKEGNDTNRHLLLTICALWFILQKNLTRLQPLLRI